MSQKIKTEHIKKLYLTIGLPASGKSSYAKGRAEKDPTIHRYNYDDIRFMLCCTNDGNLKSETIVRHICREGVKKSLSDGFSVIVDNTSLSASAQESWKQLAHECGALFEVVDFRNVPVDTCIHRDSMRQGKEHVSAPVIWNMALMVGLMKFDKRPIVIVDVDGTLADHEGIRSPYDESKVHMDRPYPVIVEWVRNLISWQGYCVDCRRCIEALCEGAFEQGLELCRCDSPNPVPNYQVIVVSGRSTLCAESTYNWVRGKIGFTAMFMRNRGDRRPDTVVKKEILDRLLKLVPKEQIAFVLDDRPSVIRMWKENGLRVFPVRGACEEF